MDSTDQKYLEILAEALETHLSRPLRLDEDAQRFVAATYGDIEETTLRALFDDTTSSDAETLLELLLFPDIAFQLQIEPLLSQINSIPHPEPYICGCLHKNHIKLSLDLENGSGHLHVPLPDEFLDRFVDRLRITNHWPAALDTPLTEHLTEGEQMRVRVMLRNGNVVAGDSFTELCGRFLAAITSRHRDFWPALSLMIHMAADLEAAEDPFGLLCEHKQRAFQMLEQQREFERRLRRSNIETLLGQGQRAPTLAKADALNQMRLVDTVCHAVFGKTTYFQPVAFDA